MSTLVFSGRRRVIGIALPKGKPDSPMRNVELELQGSEKYPFSGWIFADKLGDVAIGDLVACTIEKSDEGYKNVTSIEKVSGSGEIPEEEAHGPEVARGGGDRAETPADSAPEAPAARNNFDSYAYLAACGMVDLAYEELHDAAQVSEWSVSPALVQDVARRLLAAADAAQHQLTGSTNRNALSHTRARGAVRTVLRSYPAAEWVQIRNGTPELVEEWDSKCLGASLKLLQIAETI